MSFVRSFWAEPTDAGQFRALSWLGEESAKCVLFAKRCGGTSTPLALWQSIQRIADGLVPPGSTLLNTPRRAVGVRLSQYAELTVDAIAAGEL